MNRRLLALALVAVSCGPAAPFELPPLGPLPDLKPPLMTTKPPPVVAGVRGLPCEVRTVVEAHCTGCHGGQMYVRHLTTVEDFRAERHQGKTIGHEAVERLSPGAKYPMPPELHDTKPTPEEALVLINWVTAGMPDGDCGEAAAH